ncbi:TonB-dependent receptor [Psychrobium sp. nBUS_13]|uniref:TonB-dependent receptor n=1 Tax=Psychrobium sp. nBUS_13 TaxID=3395319 RepID=UPI003EBBC17E
MNLSKHTTAVSISTKVSLLALAMSSAMGVQAAPEEKPTATKNDVERIMVTARKRSESLQETPTAITVIDSGLLDDNNVSNLDDVGKYVPNLNISRFGAGNTAHASVFIRGIGLQDHIITTDPGVGVYVDGVYLGRQMGANLSLPNIASVEVLRGPQGTLYGRNTLGGAINVITKQPGDENVFNISAKAGSRGRVETTAYYNNELTDAWSVSASGAYKKRDGVGTAINLDNPEREIGEENEFSGRIATKFQASEDLSFVFAVDTVDNKSGQSPYTIEMTDALDANDPFNGDFPLLNESLLPTNPDDLGTAVAGLESTEASGWGAALTTNWSINEQYDAKFIISKRHSDYEGGLDDDGTVLHLSEFPEVGGADQESVELQLNGTFDNMDFVSGLYYFTEDGYTKSGPWTFSPWNTPNGKLTNGDDSFGDYGYFDLNQVTTSYAAYFNMSYSLTERLDIGGGLRYSSDEKKANAMFPSFAERKFVEADFSEVTWDVNAAYRLDSGHNVYATIQKGYQTGGFPPRPFGGAAQFVAFDETTAINYEVGFKGQVLDNLTLMTAVFYTKYSDLALPYSDPTAGGGFVTIIENAGESEAKGIEIEATLNVTDDFDIRAAFGYLDAEISQIDDGVTGIELGATPALTPKYTATLAASYYVELDSGASLAFNADYSYRSSMQGQSSNNPTEEISSRDLAGFNVKYQPADALWSLSLYGENVFNEVYDQGRLQQAGFVGIVRSNDRSEFGLRYTHDFEL